MAGEEDMKNVIRGGYGRLAPLAGLDTTGHKTAGHSTSVSGGASPLVE